MSDMKLSERVKVLGEAAPWVVEEVQHLERWKEEQISVMTPVLDYARSVGECPIGHSLSHWLVEDHKRLSAENANLRLQCGGMQMDLDELATQPGKIPVSIEPLRQVLNALVNAPHLIRELQATREPVELFADNPINVLVAEFNAARDAAGEKP